MTARRLLAIDTSGTNAVVALPALKAALTAEPSRPRGAARLDDNLTRAPSSAWVCAGLQEAIRALETPAARK